MIAVCVLHSDQFGRFKLPQFVQLFMQAQNLKLRLQIHLIIVSRIQPERGSAKYMGKGQMKRYSA